MKTNIYFFKTNAYNAVVFDQCNGHYFLNEGDRNGFIDGIVDLYADDAENALKDYFTAAIKDETIDITGMCNSSCVMDGDFDPDEEGVEAILLASYDDVDTSELVEGLILKEII